MTNDWPTEDYDDHEDYLHQLIEEREEELKKAAHWLSTSYAAHDCCHVCGKINGWLPDGHDDCDMVKFILAWGDDKDKVSPKGWRNRD